MSRDILDESLAEGKAPEKKEHYESVDMGPTQQAIDALLKPLDALFSEDDEGIEDVFTLLLPETEDLESLSSLAGFMDTLPETLSAMIPEGVQGQQVLDAVFEGAQEYTQGKSPNASGFDFFELFLQNIIDSIPLIYMYKVVEALYLKGHNGLMLDFPKNSMAEVGYLNGTEDEMLSLHVTGDLNLIMQSEYSRISVSGNVEQIELCMDCRFDIHGENTPTNILESAADCEFYFHNGTEDTWLELLGAPSHNRYFVCEEDEWTEVTP